MRRPPRRLLAVLAALAALLAGIAGAAYYRVVVVGNRDVHHGAEVPFQTRSVPLPTQAQTQTTPRRPGAKRRPSIAWAVWGFDPQHTRYNPEAHTRPPFR